jgi:hypothetical protein
VADGVPGNWTGAAARAVWASAMPIRTTAPPSTCQALSSWSSHSQAMTEASTGSTVATSPAVVGGRCGSAAIESQNGTIAPRTTIQATRTHSGSCNAPIDTGTRSARTAGSNSHHGAAIDQNTAAATKLQQVSATGSRASVPRSPIR